MGFMVFLVIYVGISVFIAYKLDVKRMEKIRKQKEQHEKDLIVKGYIKPQFKELSKEEIDDMHSRGKITPMEKVKEWEGLDLCAPGDAIGSAAWRCEKFDNCHDCLVDYASSNTEYNSIFDDLKIICK